MLRFKLLVKFLILFGIVLFGTKESARAASEIIHPYQSVRSIGMGGVILSTGLYDENFYNNPARVLANPKTRFSLLQLTPIETNPTLINDLPTLLKSDHEVAPTLAALSGNYLHARAQIVAPAYYLAANEDRRWALAVGLMASFQSNWLLAQSYQATLTGILDVGPTVSFAHRFLEDRLALGVNAHLTYRASAQKNYTLLDYLNGSSLALNSIAGEGSMLNFDLGATYKLTRVLDFDVELAAAFQNIFGGDFRTGAPHLFSLSGPVLGQPSSFGLGTSFNRASLGILRDTVLALEVSGIGNNNGGSFYRLLHLGVESNLFFFKPRLGLNQGYFSAGLGMVFGFFTLDAATYGEEIGLNAGSLEDRRYTLSLGFHI